METAEHIALAQTYLMASERLELDGVHQLAAEAVWGAANLVIEACRHVSGLRHGNTREKLRYIQAMDITNTDENLPKWESGLAIVRDELHHHFYANHLSAGEAADALALGREFVDRLLSIAETSGNQAGTT